ncbi:MAG: hypothetical protein IKI54_06395 [Lachnospiraceae bacterium]|nr:hypothetical protein [Lachnospiraceae bacterium]
MTGELLKIFGISLGLTLLIEMGLAWVFRVRTKRGLLIVMLANILTNPAVVFLNLFLQPYTGDWHLALQLLLEAGAVLTEAFVYLQFRTELQASLKPFPLSLVLNACSYGTGLLISRLL